MPGNHNSTRAGLVSLAAGELRLALAPEVGGSIARFTRRWNKRDGQGRVRDIDWLRPATEIGLAERNPLAMASFSLLPFCNRTRNGRANFESREICFPPNHPAEDSRHPLHGIGWQRSWVLASCNADQAVLTLEVPASKAWPWRFSARQHFCLTVSDLTVSILLTNEDTAAMPAGIGHHPYFPHEVGPG